MKRPPGAVVSARYMPVPVYGTSPCDHLAYEVTERLQASGYASRFGAERAWIRACRAANDIRAAQGMSRVSRPACEVVMFFSRKEAEDALPALRALGESWGIEWVDVLRPEVTP